MFSICYCFKNFNSWTYVAFKIQ